MCHAAVAKQANFRHSPKRRLDATQRPEPDRGASRLVDDGLWGSLLEGVAHSVRGYGKPAPELGCERKLTTFRVDGDRIVVQGS